MFLIPGTGSILEILSLRISVVRGIVTLNTVNIDTLTVPITLTVRPLTNFLFC